MYTENGRLIIKTNYKDGKKHGLSESYDYDDEPLSQSYYKDGEMYEISECYDDDDEPFHQSYYKDGEMYDIWDEDKDNPIDT